MKPARSLVHTRCITNGIGATCRVLPIIHPKLGDISASGARGRVRSAITRTFQAKNRWDIDGELGKFEEMVNVLLAPAMAQILR